MPQNAEWRFCLCCRLKGGVSNYVFRKNEKNWRCRIFFIKEKQKRKKRYKISKSIPQITKTIMEPSNHDSLSLFDVTQQQEKKFWVGINSSSFGNSPKSNTYLFSEGPKICRFCWFLQIFRKKVEIYRIYFTQLQETERKPKQRGKRVVSQKIRIKMSRSWVGYVG